MKQVSVALAKSLERINFLSSSSERGKNGYDIIATDVAPHSLALTMANANNNQVGDIIDTSIMDYFNLTSVQNVKKSLLLSRGRDEVNTDIYYNKTQDNGFSLIFGSSLQGLFQGTGRRDGTLWKVLDELLDANPASLVILGHTVSEQIDLPPDPFPYRLVRRLSASDDFFGDMKTRNGETSDYEICVFQLKATNQERLKSSPFTSKRYFLDEL